MQVHDYQDDLQMATRKGKQLEVTVDVGGYYDTRIGFLDDASAERIRKGEDFDSVIEEFSGTHPHSSESAVVGTYIAEARNLDDIVSRISCKVGNKKVPFSVVALAITDGKGVPFESDVGNMILPKRLLITYRKEDARVEVRC